MQQDKENKLVEAPSSTLESLTAGSILKVMPQERIEALKKMIGPKYKNITNAELELFAMIAVRYDLDPFIKEIFFTKQKGAVVPITARDGFLKIAKKDPNYNGLESFSVCENDEFSFDAGSGEITHRINFKNRGKVVGAWARAYHKSRPPAVAYVNFDEYNKVGYDSWKDYPSAMIQKVAESFVLRRQYSIHGIVGAEEIGAEPPSKGLGIQVPDFSDPLDIDGEVVDAEFEKKPIAPEETPVSATPFEKPAKEMGEIEQKMVLNKVDKDIKEKEEEISKLADEIYSELNGAVKTDEQAEKIIEEAKKVTTPKPGSIKDKLQQEAQEKAEEELPDIDDIPEPEEADIPQELPDEVKEEVKLDTELKHPILIKIWDEYHAENQERISIDKMKEVIAKHKEAGAMSVKEYMEVMKEINALTG